MKLLCAITDWKTEKAQRGRAVGKEITSRKVVAFDNWNIVIGTQRGDENGNIVGERFVPSMRLLLDDLSRNEYKQSMPSVAGKIASALEKLTGNKAPEISNDWRDYGKKLDDVFKTSFGRDTNYPPQVIKRIFGITATEE